MKFFLKCFLSLVLLSSLSSCYITRSVILKEHSYLENFDKVFLDQNRQRLIFITRDEKFHYIIPDDDQTMLQLAMWSKLGEVRFSTKYGSALLKNDHDFEIPYFILTTTGPIYNNGDINFLENLGFNEATIPGQENSRFTKNYVSKNGKKVGAQESNLRDGKMMNLDSPYQIEFLVTNETIGQKTSKLILLPFAAIADAVLLPVTIPVWLMTRDKN